MGIMSWEDKGEEERFQCVVCFLCLFLLVDVSRWESMLGGIVLDLRSANERAAGLHFLMSLGVSCDSTWHQMVRDRPG